MNQRITAILVIALLVSAGATYVVYRLIASRASQSAAMATVPVIRAARTLELGTLIKDSDLTTGPWAGPVPAGMATKKDGLIGRGVVAPIYDGEPVMDSRLAPMGAGGGLAATIPPGKRAVAVKVDEIVGVAGFAVPGMRVDVLVAGTAPGQGAEGRQVKTILQNIEVLSAGQNYQKDNEGKPVVVQVVNLLVTPEQAETLSLASSETKIQLVLRNPLDTEAVKVPGTQMATMFGGTPKPPAPAPRPRTTTVAVKPQTLAPIEKVVIPMPPYQIEIFNGATRSEAKFARPPEVKQ
ncbi:MAG TPA: Flp pilus assembly protein CpaB [Bryobacteraceae bacterium]|jgi:pilus assembly protein CpaB